MTMKTMNFLILGFSKKDFPEMLDKDERNNKKIACGALNIF